MLSMFYCYTVKQRMFSNGKQPVVIANIAYSQHHDILFPKVLKATRVCRSGDEKQKIQQKTTQN